MKRQGVASISAIYLPYVKTLLFPVVYRYIFTSFWDLPPVVKLGCKCVDRIIQTSCDPTCKDILRCCAGGPIFTVLPGPPPLVNDHHCSFECLFFPWCGLVGFYEHLRIISFIFSRQHTDSGKDLFFLFNSFGRRFYCILNAISYYHSHLIFPVWCYSSRPISFVFLH